MAQLGTYGPFVFSCLYIRPVLGECFFLPFVVPGSHFFLRGKVSVVSLQCYVRQSNE